MIVDPSDVALGTALKEWADATTMHDTLQAELAKLRTKQLEAENSVERARKVVASYSKITTSTKQRYVRAYGKVFHIFVDDNGRVAITQIVPEVIAE